jgi:hypothetical protein
MTEFLDFNFSSAEEISQTLGQRQPLFKPVITSIADMAEQQKLARQSKRRLPIDRP